ncbi:unnamed protein product [Diamesa tonsa]
MDVEEVYKLNLNYIKTLSTSADLPCSPIDLNVTKSIKKSLPKLNWNGYTATPRSMKVTNNGNTVVVSTAYDNCPYLDGGPLDDRYNFSQIHYHWGHSTLEGSYHSIDGNYLPLEVHCVHFKSSYGDQTTALQHPDGIVIVVIFYDINTEKSLLFDIFSRNILKVKQPNVTVTIEPFSVLHLLHKFEIDYFLYWGQVISNINTNNQVLKQSVLWLISRECGYVSLEQLKLFRHLLNEHFKPIQHTHNRTTEDENKDMDTKLFHINPKTPITNSTLSPIVRSQEYLTEMESTLHNLTDFLYYDEEDAINQSDENELETLENQHHDSKSLL